jgi:hypothetical protein
MARLTATGEVLTPVPVKIDDFWDVVPCILVNSYRQCFCFLAAEKYGGGRPL